jgi:hypothetical protein
LTMNRISDEDLKALPIVDTLELMAKTLAGMSQPPRLLGLENAIVAAKPSFIEAAESILSPMKSWLDTLDRHAAARVQNEYDALFDALVKQAEERGEL